MVKEVRTENGLRHVRNHEDPLEATAQAQADGQTSRTVRGDPRAIDGAEEGVGQGLVATISGGGGEDAHLGTRVDEEAETSERVL